MGPNANLSWGKGPPSQHEIPQGTRFLLLAMGVGAARGWCRVWAHRRSACLGPAAGVPPTRGQRRGFRPQPRPHPEGGSEQGGHCLGHFTPATPSARAVHTVRGFSNHCRGGLAGPRPGAHGVPASERQVPACCSARSPARLPTLPAEGPPLRLGSRSKLLPLGPWCQ